MLSIAGIAQSTVECALTYLTLHQTRFAVVVVQYTAFGQLYNVY